jgi:exodeoxyribonuclease VII large subunit
MAQGQFSLNFAAPERRIYKVAELSKRIRERLETEFADVWVEGEISNCRPATSGHIYFTLKDDGAQLRCVCFKQAARLFKFRPEDGLQVTARGRISVYEARGEYQLYVEMLEPQGVGALQLAFEQLKKKLFAEGLFDVARKKPLPRYPRRIGIITSPRGAVIQDMVRILERRHKNLHLLVYPTRVQGESAADEIINGLRFFHKPGNPDFAVDVVIIARGGGSLEDLWAFNEERLARAIAASRLPVISAVGHETDFTICDFVADLRAPTPSAAAELVIETLQQIEQRIDAYESNMRRAIQFQLMRLRHELTDWVAHRGFQTLRAVVEQAAQRSDEATYRLSQSMHAAVRKARRRWERHDTVLRHMDLRARQQRARMQLAHLDNRLGHNMRMLLNTRGQTISPLAAKLHSLSPTRILERGYAIAFDANGNVLKDVSQTGQGQPITVQIARGQLAAEVKKII